MSQSKGPRTKFLLRLPEALHQRAVAQAEKEGQALNDLITTAVENLLSGPPAPVPAPDSNLAAEVTQLRARVAELEAQPAASPPAPDLSPAPVVEYDPEEKARRLVRAGAPMREEGETEESFARRQDEYLRALRVVRGVGDAPAWLRGGPSAREAALAVTPRYRGDAEY